MAYDVVPRVRVETRLQVRFFVDSEIAPLESAINEWLTQNPRREIVQIRQSVIPGGQRSDIIVSIWYVAD